MYFRTRIFAISILTVSLVLAVVLTFSWSRIMKIELDHLDARLCMEGNRIMHNNRPQDARHLVAKQSTLEGDELLENRLIYDLIGKLRISSPEQLMLSIESTQYGRLLKSEGADIAQLITTAPWTKATHFLPGDKNINLIPCQLTFFEHQQDQWRASYFQGEQAHSFIAVNLSTTTSQLKSTMRTAFLVVIPLSLLLSILGAWFITSNSLRPINKLHKSMNRVTQKDLSHRLSAHHADQEFKRLIQAYNTMLDRLEDSFQQVSRFTADAAHELKTPLTVLRGKLEQAISFEDPSQLDINAILDEVGHLSSITRKLLLLSQADSGAMALHLETINMSDLLDELTDDMELLSDELTLNCTIERGLLLQGDSVLIRQLLNNLLVNVMRYSLHNKGITIQAKQNKTFIELFISNYCSPKSSAVRAQLFERFYRGEPEQLQGISGSGLGLSLAREIARAHAGDLTLEASDPDVFTMRLLLPISQ